MTNSIYKVLFIGDIVGQSGRSILINQLKSVKSEHNINFIIANGENSAGGFGITEKIADSFFKLGIDVITTGNHVWKNKDIFNIIDKENNLLKPLNYPESTPGHGYCIVERQDIRVLVINLLGRINLYDVDCPFQKIDVFLKEIDKNDYDISFVDFHAETTSEKVAMGWFLNGRVSAVAGTHTHIQTSDERILDKGTAYITDVGMTGSFDSVLGIDKDRIIKHFLSRMPIKYKLALENIGMNSIIIEFDREKNKPVKIERLNIFEK